MASKVRCSYCKAFIEKSGAYTVGISSFCNRDHFLAKQEASSQPKTGTSKASKSYRHKKAQREVTKVSPETVAWVLRRDNNQCVMCGSKSDLALHHVIYKSDKTNKIYQDTQSNLITLCNTKCHLGVVHRDKKRWQKICLAYIWLREVENKYLKLTEIEEKYDYDI